MPFNKVPNTDTAVVMLGYAYSDACPTPLIAGHLVKFWLAEQTAAPKRPKLKQRSARSSTADVSNFRRQPNGVATLKLPKRLNSKAVSRPTSKLDLHRFSRFERVEIDEYSIDILRLIKDTAAAEKMPASFAPMLRGTIERFFQEASTRFDLAISKI